MRDISVRLIRGFAFKFWLKVFKEYLNESHICYKCCESKEPKETIFSIPVNTDLPTRQMGIIGSQ
jgi:hypothetical protein